MKRLTFEKTIYVRMRTRGDTRRCIGVPPSEARVIVRLYIGGGGGVTVADWASAALVSIVSSFPVVKQSRRGQSPLSQVSAEILLKESVTWWQKEK